MGEEAANSSGRGYPTKEMEMAWPPSSCGRQALNSQWNPQGQRKRGRSRHTWRREPEDDFRRTAHKWKQLERIAQDRGDWRVVGLCSGRTKGPK